MYAAAITGIDYLVAGKQKQWGAYIANGSVAYPIPFTSAVYRIIAFGGENRGYQTNAEFNLSNLKQVENAYNYPGQYIAVGK